MADSTDPLWLQIRNHPSLFCLHPTPQQIGTILRVIADAIAPVPPPGTIASAWHWTRCEEYMVIRAKLLAEAERAEKAT